MDAGVFDLACELEKLFELDGDFFDSETQDPDTGEFTDPHDFSADEGLFVVKRGSWDADGPALLSGSVSGGEISFPDAPGGQWRIAIDGAATAGLEPGCYFYWLSFWPAASPELAFPVLEGKFEVRFGGGGIQP